MGLRAKSKQRAERLKKKRATREAQRAKYESFRKSGNNSKRTFLRQKRSKKGHIRPHSHASGDCGNIGCVRCSKVERAWRKQKELMRAA